MQSNMRLIRSSLRGSVFLALIYVIVVFACMLLVGRLTSGSWEATFLGISWSTIIDFEIALIGVLAFGFLIGILIGAIRTMPYNAVREKPTKTTERAIVTTRSREVRLLEFCLVIPLFTLVALRLSALVGLFSLLPTSAQAEVQGGDVSPRPSLISSVINSSYREAEPSFTADGKTMFFNCYNGDICVSRLIGSFEDGDWSTSKRLRAPINTKYEEVEPLINATGDKLYFTSNRPHGLLNKLTFMTPFTYIFRVVNTIASDSMGRTFFGGLGYGDVYVSYLIDGEWSNPENINNVDGEPPINTAFDDHCLFFSSDGAEAFWTSTRPGSYGSDDIWTSRRVGNEWTTPQNLGPEVNGPGSEHTSIPTPDNQSLYITTSRFDGFGGEDIYITTRSSEGKWGALVNLGPLVNGPGDDRCPAWTPDLRFFLYDSVRSGGSGARDIWWVNFKEVEGYQLARIATSPRSEIVRQLSSQVSGR